MIKIIVATWYDSVTPDSAEHGDYESTGNDEKSFIFGPDEVEQAIDQYIYEYKRNSWDHHGFYFVNSVLYDADGETDYFTGAIDYQRLTIQVDSSNSIKYPEQKELETKLNKLINARLSLSNGRKLTLVV